MHQAVLDEFDQYLELECGRSEHTRRAYRGDLRSLGEFLGDDAAIADLDLVTLRSWLAEQANRGAARTTLSRRTSAVKTFTAWAVRRGLLETDPAVRLQTPRPVVRCPPYSARTRLSMPCPPRIPVRNKVIRWRCATG